MNKPKKLPSLSALIALVAYFPNTGVLVWRQGNARRKAGAVAGSLKDNGYRQISFGTRKLLAHRVAWKIFYGSDPVGDIDHIDMNKDNNAITNLRIATKTENQGNRGIQKNNTSGVKGVTWHSKAKKWQVRVSRKHVGLYEDMNSAINAYTLASSKQFGGFNRVAVKDD